MSQVKIQIQIYYILFLYWLQASISPAVAFIPPNWKLIQASQFQKSYLKYCQVWSSKHGADDDEPIFEGSESVNSQIGNETNSGENSEVNVLKKQKSKRSKKYSPSDNRDQLPFVVSVTTPDPYTKPEWKKERARQNTEQDRKFRSLSGNNRGENKRPRMTASLLDVSKNQDTILGEFQLDPSTTCGDIVVVGMQSYLVQKARCQYQYTGGQKFTMVRKILEVKPIQRVQTESQLLRSLENTLDLESIESNLKSME
jgi:hypothetical protein